MIRLVVILILAFAIFWCYNNINFSNIMNKAGTSIQNEKTIKAVREKRQFDYEQEQAAMRNN